MIELAYPLALLALLAVPVIIVLHLLRPRRRHVIVASTRLWQEALAERARGPGLRRLTRYLSLLLLVAAALTLGLALANPQWLARTSQRPEVVLVLDTSASMKALSRGGSTRFDEALARANRVLDELPTNGRMLVMTSGRHARLRTGFEADRTTLRRALGALRPGDEAGHPREALTLALSLLRNREHGRVHFITDGAFDADIDPRMPGVQFGIVGTPARNIAITRFDFRPEPAGDERFQMLAAVRNYTDARAVVPLEVRLDGRIIHRESIALDAGSARTLVLPFQGRAAGRASARIDVQDDLAADNEAFAMVNAVADLRVLLHTGGNFHLESVLAALPGVHVTKSASPPGDDFAERARAHDLVIFDGVLPPRLPPGSYLLVDTVAPGLPFTAAGRIARPRVAGRGTSALVRDVDLTGVRIDAALRVTVDRTAPGLQRLFWSQETDLALALLDEDLRLVYLGFDVTRSSLPLQAAFPLFISQRLEWLRPRGDDSSATHVAPGTARVVRLPAGVTQASVTLPNGERHTVSAEGGLVHFDATAQSGIYRLAAAGREHAFAVTFADARESDLSMRFQPAPRIAATGAAATARSSMPLWPYLLLIALALLAVEWTAWARSRRLA